MNRKQNKMNNYHMHSHQIKTQKRPQYMTLNIKVLTWYRHRIVAELNVLVIALYENN